MKHSCRAVNSKAYAGMTWLDRVEGCACCLSNTANVSPCYLQAKGCQSADTLDGCCNDSYDLNSAEGQVNPLDSPKPTDQHTACAGGASWAAHNAFHHWCKESEIFGKSHTMSSHAKSTHNRSSVWDPRNSHKGGL